MTPPHKGTITSRFAKRHPEIQQLLPASEGSRLAEIDLLRLKLLLEKELGGLDFKTSLSRRPIPVSGARADYVYIDEAHDLSKYTLIGIDHASNDEIKKDPSNTKSWVMNHRKEPVPVKGAENLPSKTKRASLRAKRKKRK